eukprot:s1780_g6.t1
MHAQQWKLTGLFPPSLVRLAMARTPGDQTIYRSELLAVLTIVEWFDRATVFTDCASVIQAWEACQKANSLVELLHLENLDLVERLWSALKQGDQRIFKVPAHVEDFTGFDDLAIYRCLGNRLANDAALTTCKYFQPEISKLADEMYVEVREQQRHLHRLYEMFVELRVHFAKLEANKVEQAVHADLQVDAPPTPLEVLSSWSFEHVWQPPAPGINMLDHCAWGKPIAELLVQWMAAVRWPEADDAHPDDPGVTWLELSLSFLIHSRVILPVKRVKPDGVAYLQTFDSWSTARLFNVGQSELAHTMSDVVLQIRKLHSSAIWPTRAHGFVRSVYQLGCPSQPSGIKTRPMYPHQERVCHLLYKYLRQHKGFTALLEVPDLEIRSVDSMRCCATWQDGLKKAAKGYLQIKAWQRAPDTFVSHCWASHFWELLEILQRYDENTNRNNFFFLDVFSMNQHDFADISGEQMEELTVSTSPRSSTSSVSLVGLKDIYQTMLKALTRSIETPGRVLLALTPHEQPLLLTRSWCLYEIYIAWKVGAEVSCGFVPEAEQSVKKSLLESDALIKTMLNAVDAENSRATMETDRQMILSLIKQAGVSRFNTFVREKLSASLRMVALTTLVRSNTTTLESLNKSEAEDEDSSRRARSVSGATRSDFILKDRLAHLHGLDSDEEDEFSI